MDEYGFAAAATAGLIIFDAGARHSGRTARMIERLTDGDQVVVSNSRFAAHLRARLKEAGKLDVRVIAQSAEIDPHQVLEKARGRRTLFDHEWQMQFHRLWLARGQREIDRILTAAGSPPYIDPNARHFADRYDPLTDFR